MKPLLVFAVVLAGLPACFKKEVVYLKDADLIGRYRPTKEGPGHTLDLNADGQFHHVIARDGVKLEYAGPWELVDDLPHNRGTTLVLTDFCIDGYPGWSKYAGHTGPTDWNCSEGELSGWYVSIQVHQGRIYLPIESDLGTYFVKDVPLSPER